MIAFEGGAARATCWQKLDLFRLALDPRPLFRSAIVAFWIARTYCVAKFSSTRHFGELAGIFAVDHGPMMLSSRSKGTEAGAKT